MKIKQDHEKCIGCGACVAVCPENWEMDSDDKAKFKNAESDLECNKKAAAGCPVKIITIEE